jgi:hypothetical protein
MTKTILVTNLKEIKGIKIVCTKCDAYWFIPLGATDPPHQCISCTNNMPKDSIKNALEQVANLINMMGEFDFKAYIETEEEKQKT